MRSALNNKPSPSWRATTTGARGRARVRSGRFASDICAGLRAGFDTCAFQARHHLIYPGARAFCFCMGQAQSEDNLDRDRTAEGTSMWEPIAEPNELYIMPPHPNPNSPKEAPYG
jgi:hypothetical protein